MRRNIGDPDVLKNAWKARGFRLMPHLAYNPTSGGADAKAGDLDGRLIGGVARFPSACSG
jgi:hypothetical protein